MDKNIFFSRCLRIVDQRISSPKYSKGFSLAELLIVVAIIAVLTAIAIPVFSNQLEKSREATDLANLRAAYAEQATIFNQWDGKKAIPRTKVDAHQTKEGWQILDGESIAKIGDVNNTAYASGNIIKGGHWEVYCITWANYLGGKSQVWISPSGTMYD